MVVSEPKYRQHHFRVALLPWPKMADEATRRVVSEIPVLKTNAGPRDRELWVQRLKEEYQSLIRVSCISTTIRVSRGVAGNWVSSGIGSVWKPFPVFGNFYLPNLQKRDDLGAEELLRRDGGEAAEQLRLRAQWGQTFRLNIPVMLGPRLSGR